MHWGEREAYYHARKTSTSGIIAFKSGRISLEVRKRMYFDGRFVHPM